MKNVITFLMGFNAFGMPLNSAVSVQYSHEQ